MKYVKEEFHNRFMEVLCMKPVAWWSEKLDVVPSLINGRWKKGSFPNADNLIKICQLSGVSANWLLLGIGPKNIENKGMDEDTRRSLQNYITQLEDQNEEVTQKAKKILNDAEIIKQLKWFSETFHTDQHQEPIDQLKKLTGEEVFNRIFMPGFIFIKMLTDILFKATEQYAISENGTEILTGIIDWIRANYEKNLYMAKGGLKDMESLYYIMEIKNLFSNHSAQNVDRVSKPQS